MAHPPATPDGNGEPVAPGASMVEPRGDQDAQETEGSPGSGVLAGRFELREPVGSGGMAIVYRAWDRALRRSCAVKVLGDLLSRDEHFRRRFRQEAEAARGLTHPHIVRVYDWGESGSYHYIAMEYVPGGTLRDRVSRHGPFPEGTAIRLAADVADALAYAHAQGVIHRDIKPQNILLTQDGTAKVADFGIARTLDASGLTRTGIVMGSAQYLSPEQARGDPFGPCSDLYALGVVLFEMLAGRVPFDGESAVAIALRHLRQPPPDLRQIRPDLAPATVALVARLLAKAPEERYPSAAVLTEALRQITVAQPGNGKPGGVSSVSDPPRADTTALRPWSALATEQIPRVAPETARLPLAASREVAKGRLTGAEGGTAALPTTGDPEAGNAGPPRLRRRPAALRTAVVGVLVALAAAGAAARYGAGRYEAIAPPLTGRTVAAASRAARAVDLQVVVAGYRQDSQAAVGAILTQDPPPGRRVRKGSSLRVIVSQGSGIVPDVRGLLVAAATSRLGATGLRLGRASYIYDWSWKPAAAGSVIYQFRPPGTHLAPSEAVDVLVSQGPPPFLVPRIPKFPWGPAPDKDRREGNDNK